MKIRYLGAEADIGPEALVHLPKEYQETAEVRVGDEWIRLNKYLYKDSDLTAAMTKVE
jgi:hypothetical protein